MSGFQATRPLDPWRWLVTPTLICVVATIFLAIPLRVFGLQLPEFVFPLAPAFAWAVIRPSILPPFFLLGMGLFLDLFWGGPLGLWAISLLAAYAGVLATRSVMNNQGPLVIWAWYGAACLLATGTAYMLTMLDSIAVPSLIGAGWQVLVNAALYPFANRLIQRFEDADVRFR